MSNRARHRSLLVVDDSFDDVRLVRRALQKAGFKSSVHWCESGETAVAYLLEQAGRACDGDSRYPGLVLLDLHMPGANGMEVLRAIKTHASLRTIPVVMLTTSADARDIDACYQLGVNSYLVKPSDFDGLVEAMAIVRAFWLELAVLPERSREATS